MDTYKRFAPSQTIPTNMETAKIKWTELERFFAAGNVYQFQVGLDLPELAGKFKNDDTKYIKLLLDTGKLKYVSDEQARMWVYQNAFIWAVVVAPFVLVQDLENESN